MRDISKNQKFNELFLKSIDETLNILGGSTKKTLLRFLKQKYQTEEKQILTNPHFLILSLREIFGEAGSAFLESRIIETLYKKLGVTAPVSLSLEDAIKNAEKIIRNLK